MPADEAEGACWREGGRAASLREGAEAADEEATGLLPKDMLLRLARKSA
jgi:hypothetical protein